MKKPAKTKAAAAARPAAKKTAAAKPAGNGAAASTDFDPAFIETLAQIVSRLDLSEVEVERHGMRIRVARQLQAAPAVAMPAPAATYHAPAPVVAPPPSLATPAPAAAENPGTVKSPMVG